jgi:hypothetical protein
MTTYEHYLAVMRSPYPSAADKEHVKVLMKKINRLKRSRDALKVNVAKLKEQQE